MKKLFTIIILFILFTSYVHSQTNLTKHNSPVLSFGSSGEWDNFGVASPSVIFDGSIYHMWYSGGDGTVSGNSIGYAASNDGLTWTKYSGNPVLTGISGEWDHHINNASVVFVNGQYMMYYSAAVSGASPERIGLATSSDGINWSKYSGNPVLTDGPSWNALLVRRPSVIHDGNLFEIWFTGNDGGTMGAYDRIGYATSTDGIIWQEYANNPVLEGDTSFQKHAGVGRPGVIRDGSQYLMYYGAADKILNRVHMWIASSSDGIMWQQSTMPVLSPDDPTEWDYNLIISSGSPILQNGTYKLWYTASSGGPGAQIGYAEGPEPNQPVAVDIKPGSAPNSWDCNDVNNDLPVAILSDANFDATTVDANSVRFGKTGSEAAEVHKKNGQAKRHEEDVNKDGLIDMVFHFRFGDTGFSCDDIPAGQKSATLPAQLTGSANGTAIEGTDVIRLVNDKLSKNLAGAEDIRTVPESYAFFQNHPNPFNPSTTITFAVPEAGEVTLAIYNLRGQLIQTLHSGFIAAGQHSVVWEGTDLSGAKVASGIYVYRLEGKGIVVSKKLVFTK